jgi:hypothetical protein
VIVAAHVAVGAAAGALLGSRGGAIVAGLALHGAQDAVPHEDIHSHGFEAASGCALLAWLALRRGLTDPAVLGAAACAAPDLEHVLPLPKPGGRDLYPSHRVEGWHREGALAAWLQLVVSLVIVAALTRRGTEGRCR